MGRNSQRCVVVLASACLVVPALGSSSGPAQAATAEGNLDVVTVQHSNMVHLQGWARNPTRPNDQVLV